eukprot:TRINITY_DN8993_c0_g1_i3.p1 TRINITY_DN8993_c0_g1~~TRINITY_DN8993_c0_g1_i3.p1  ORF type:complete len:153 (+),score=41.11 TRINITY_DN8993_c0_g1_i3:172-630(+)
MGLSPQEIHTASTAALRFWLEQKVRGNEKEVEVEVELESKQKRLVGNGRKRLTEADALQKTLMAGRDELQQQLRQVEEHAAAFREEATGLRSKLTKVRQAHNDALSQAAGLLPGRTPSRRAAAESFELQRPQTPGGGLAPKSAARSRSPLLK